MDRKIMLALSALMLLCSPHSWSQEKIKSSYYDNFSPATPAKGGFGSFGNTKIDYYTGMPEVSLELLTLKGLEFSLPVSLSYDASGVRTDDLSGPVGLKWNLNAGGFVARELNGLPDEHPDRGYLKYSKETNDYQNVNGPEWANACENMERDCAPDIFSVSINGRTIRFFFDKYREAHTIPRQNVRIRHTFSLNSSADLARITAFEVTLEDGTVYTFGGTAETIEQRSVERFIIKTSVLHKSNEECVYEPPFPPNPKPYATYYCHNGWDTRFDTKVETSLKKLIPYNSKWYLRSVRTPSNETTTFTYAKMNDVTYALRPSSILIRNVTGTIPLYERKSRECIAWLFGICTSEVDRTYQYLYPAAVRKFVETDPGSKPELILDPNAVTPTFDPYHYKANFGNANFYHALVTESNIRLTEIRAANGNRVVFTSSSRQDLPHATKYDMISLYDMNNQLVQSRKLTYDIVESPKENEYLWFGEALLLKFLSEIRAAGPYFADYFLRHSPNDIDDGNLSKYVFESLKAYNYKRTFLKSIDDVTDPNITCSLYGFTYSDVGHLRRRTTTFHDAYGFQRAFKESDESITITTGRVAKIANSYAPTKYLGSGSKYLAGRLSSISYPTGGATKFFFPDSLKSPLRIVQDVDEKGNVVRQREMRYSNYLFQTAPVIVSYQDFFSQAANGWMKYEISSSSAQNDFYPHALLIPRSQKTTVYDGTRAKNNGWEEFTFTKATPDTAFADIATTIYSNPAEKNKDGSPLQNIFPFPRPEDRSHRRGMLWSHKVFSANKTQPVSETRYEYDINPDGYTPVRVTAFKGSSFTWTTKETTSFWYGVEEKAVKRYRWGRYRMSSDWVVLKKKTTVTYDNVVPADKIEAVTEYSYDPKHLQNTETRTYLSSNPGVKTITHTKFVTHTDYAPYKDCAAEYKSCYDRCANNPTDFCYAQCANFRTECEKFVDNEERGSINNLLLIHSISTPIEVQNWIEENGIRTLQSSVIYKYARVGNAGYVRKKQVWATKAPLTSTQYKSSYCNPAGVFVMDPNMQMEHTFDAYDASTLRLLRQTSNDGTVESYNWSHNGSYVSSVTTNPGVYEHKFSYTHKPLVGLLTSTDPNSITTSYAYDAYGRVARILKADAMQTRYFYHKASDTYNETLSATISLNAPRLVGQKIRFSTTADSRSWGKVEYAWSMVPKTSLGVLEFAEHTFTAPGKYTISLTKKHPEFGTATAKAIVDIYAARKGVICVDGPSQIDIPSYATPTLYGLCTSVAGTQTTRLKAEFQGFCGAEEKVKFKWEIWNASKSAWEIFSTSGPTVDAPSGFSKRLPGEYRVRCTMTDECSYQVVSAVTSLFII